MTTVTKAIQSAALALSIIGVGLGAVATAHAGTITGTVTAQVGGAAIAGAEVRVWVNGVKGWTIQSMTTTAANGSYSLTVAGGGYLIDARGPAGGGNFGDRWYDVAAPITAADPYTTGELLEALTTISLKGKRVAVVHHGERSQALTGALAALGVELEEVSLYEWALPDDIAPPACPG